MQDPQSTFYSDRMPGDGLRDRRLHPRVGEPVDVSIYALGLAAPVEGVTRDIGPQGLCVETESPIGLDEARRIVLHLPDGEANMRVRCCWQREAPGRQGILSGFRFENLGVQDTELLWAIVFRRARELASFICGHSSLGQVIFDDAVDLAMHSRLVRFATGDWVYRQGSSDPKSGSAYLILQGCVEIESLNEEAESVHLERLESGAFFGGLPMVASATHPETALAHNACELLEIDSFSYQYLQSDRPAAAFAVTRALMARYARRLSELTARAPLRPRRPVHRFQPLRPGDEPDLDLRYTAPSRDD